MAETGGKKKKKAKGKTVNLTEFLANGKDDQRSAAVTHAAAMYSNRSTSWADETEDLNTQVDTAWPNDYSATAETRMQAAMDRIALPSAPRAARGPDIDFSKLPKEPPFTAFLGNLPYNVDKEDILEFFHGIKVTEVRLPFEQGGERAKGFGYAEFEDLASLTNALSLNNEQLKNRRIRVDIAGHQQQSDREGRERMPREPRDQGPDRTDNDWRIGPDVAMTSSRTGPPNQYGDQNGGFDRDFGDKGYDRDRGYNPDRGYDRDRGYNQDRGYDRDRGYNQDRGYDRDRGYNQDRGYDRDRGYNQDRGYDRDRGYGRDQGYSRYGGGRDQGYGSERGGGGFSSGWGGGDRYDDRGPRDRFDGRRGGDRYGDRDSYERDRGYGGRYGGRDRRGDFGPRGGRDHDRGGYGDRERGGFDSGDSWRDGNRADPPHTHQNDLRNEPSGDSHRDLERIERETPKERPRLQLKPRSKAADEDQSQVSSSAIFGSAKPVDTATREKEMEERIAREKANAERKLQHEREEKERTRDSRGSRTRHDSNRSNDGERMFTRERLESSGSSGGRRERSGSTKSSGEEKHADKGRETHKEPTSPSALKPTNKEPPKEAPPPTENIWTKRMEAQKAAAAKQENEESDDTKTEITSSTVNEKEKRNSGPPSSPVRSGFGRSAPVKKEGRESAPRGRGRGRSERTPPLDGPRRDRAQDKMEQEKNPKRERKPREPKIIDEAHQPVFHKESKFSALLDNEEYSDEEQTKDKSS